MHKGRRVFSNNEFELLQGERFSTPTGFLEIVRTVATVPRPKYEVVCKQCGTINTGATKEFLTTKARCLNNGCGRPEDTTIRSFNRELRRKREEREAATQRQIENLAAELSKRAGAVRKTEQIVVQHLADDSFALSPEARNQSFSATVPDMAAALEVSARAAEEFIRAHPEYLPCPQNHKTMTEYLQRNGAALYVDVETLSKAYHRLSELGLLVERVKQPPQPPAQEQRSPIPASSKPTAHVAPERSQSSKLIRGRDLATGKVRDYTEFEVDRMSAETYRRTFFGVDGLSKRDLNLTPVFEGRLR